MEDKKISTLLDEVIETELLNLSDLDNGSEEKSNAVKDLAELYKLRIEEAKAVQASKDSRMETAIRKEQMAAQSLERFLGIGVQLIIAGGGWMLYRTCFREGMYFEETGTIRSPWTRNIMSRILPKI